MATLTVRNIDPAINERLRVRAAEHGHSMEVELRRILTEVVGSAPAPDVNLAEAIRRRFAPCGGVDDLKTHPRETVGEPPRFSAGATVATRDIGGFEGCGLALINPWEA